MKRLYFLANLLSWCVKSFCSLLTKLKEKKQSLSRKWLKKFYTNHYDNSNFNLKKITVYLIFLFIFLIPHTNFYLNKNMPKYHLFMSNTISKRLVLYTIMYILREREIDFYQEMDSEYSIFMAFKSFHITQYKLYL